MKHADHRRLLSRWGKALFRYAGVKRDDFARRTGSYRENFLHVLTICFGSSFEGSSSYWYDNSNAGAFASALLYCATNGRVTVDPEEVYNLFVKKDPGRSASSWTVNESQLLAWNIQPWELQALFRGAPRLENGFPRGAPLAVPPTHLLPPPKGGKTTVVARTQPSAPAARPARAQREPTPANEAAQPPPPPLFSMDSLPPLPSLDALPVATTLQRQNTIATLALLMCQYEILERQSGRPLDRQFSEGAMAFASFLPVAPGQGAAPAGVADDNAAAAQRPS